MVEKLKNQVFIPVWTIGVFITILLALFGYTVTISKAIQMTNSNTSAIEVIQQDLKNKVDERVYSRDIMQVNTKLDILINKNISK